MPIEPVQNPLFAGDPGLATPEQVALLAPAAAPGHFDELRGSTETQDATKKIAQERLLTPTWRDFVNDIGAEGLPELDRRAAMLSRQIKTNGVTYNAYADASAPQRPWSLDLFPLIIAPHSWQQIEAGVLQRMRVLDAVMADVYGPKRLLEECDELANRFGERFRPPALLRQMAAEGRLLYTEAA